ncbi:probable envelope ADP,ATP carrier, chloroplastic [Olea europaea subsp. europaea]|uniref:Probable envelope ADP,ATP carrier, chloroplastic n=1 Tax=Olea europaea subsp. europaea TaxID=158383 RepID=A0A8S0TVX8_OLEEU|nr:probable envelope ADP,ATP carrier, chloroplastic [Olea europaea subsp. europaea]
MAQLVKNPLVLVPKDTDLFAAGAIVGPAIKIVTTSLDHIKLLMQTHGLRAGKEGTKKAIGLVEVSMVSFLPIVLVVCLQMFFMHFY